MPHSKIFFWIQILLLHFCNTAKDEKGDNDDEGNGDDDRDENKIKTRRQRQKLKGETLGGETNTFFVGWNLDLESIWN